MGNKVRYRSERYMAYIRTKPCLICGSPSEAHHLTFAEHRAKGVKNSDSFCVPLCHGHHMALHSFAGGERSYWAVNGINALLWAEKEFEKWKEFGDGTDISE